MDKFIIDGNFFVLAKNLKKTKDGKEYYASSLYDKAQDGFEKILVFDKAIFDRYEVNKTYNIRLEVSFYNNVKRLKIL